MTPVVLAVHFPAKQLAKLRMTAMRLGAKVRVVEKREFRSPIGALTGELGLDTVIAIGEKARDIAAAAPGAQWYPSVSDAMPAVRAAFTDGTAMLVKASHAMHFENIVKELEQS